MAASNIRVDVHLTPDDRRASLRADVREGLSASPKELPPKWFYDERGSQLFEQITRLAEYYPTGAERQILLANAVEIVEQAAADTIVELGSGTSEKTLALLDAGQTQGTLERFIPFDVSEVFLRSSALQLTERYPGLEIHGVVGDFDRHLSEIPTGGRRLVVFLGGTIGNYRPVPRKEFLRQIVERMRPGDHLLLGCDLVKSVDRMELAYDDPAGVTAEFNKNILQVINRELGADFDLDRFDHVAAWAADDEWMDLGLRSRVDQEISIPGIGLTVEFEARELMRTEVSAKFHIDSLTAELAEVGLEVVSWYTDDRNDFAVSLSAVG